MTATDAIRKLTETARAIKVIEAIVAKEVVTLEATAALVAKWGVRHITEAVNREARNRHFGWGK